MQETLNNIDSKRKKLLIQLSVFGNEQTAVNDFMRFFKIDKEDEKNALLDIIYDLSKQKLIILENKNYILDEKVESFLFDNTPPDINNCKILIDYFSDLLHPPFKGKLNQIDEKMLLKVISRITGYSSELAIVSDFYAQYLTQQEDFKSATYFFQLAVDIQLKVSSTNELICNFYNHLAEAQLASRNVENAIITANKSFLIADKLSTKTIVFTYSLLSTAYFNQKKYELSAEYSEKAIVEAQKMKLSNFIIANLLYEASVMYSKTKEISKSQECVDNAIAYNEKIPVNKRDNDFVEKLKLQEQYLKLLQKVDKSFHNNFKNIHIYLLLFVIAILILVLFLL